MSSAAAIKAWETRRANLLSGAAPAPKPSKPANLPTEWAQMSAGQKAAFTRKANIIAALAPEPVVKKTPVRVERISALVAPTKVEETAGQKAAASRKALEEARAARKDVEVASPIEPGQSVSLWLKDSDVGSGERIFVVREIGPRMVKLFYPPCLQEIEVDRRTFDRDAVAYKTTVAKTIARIERASSAHDRAALVGDRRVNGVAYSPRQVRETKDLVAAFFAKGGAVHTIPEGARAMPAIDYNLADIARLVAA